MKMIKMILLLAAIIFMLGLSACGGKVCSECGEQVEKGYTALGNFYCEDCFNKVMFR